MILFFGYSKAVVENKAFFKSQKVRFKWRKSVCDKTTAVKLIPCQNETKLPLKNFGVKFGDKLSPHFR